MGEREMREGRLERAEREEGKTQLLFLTFTLPPTLSCPPPLSLSPVFVPFDLSFSFPRSLINRALFCVPLRARISLSSWHNLISLDTRGHRCTNNDRWI